MTSLLDELLLLAYDDRSGFNRAGSHVETALGGAILLELVLAERVGMEDGTVRVTDPSPLGDPILDGGLRQIAADRPRKPKQVVQRTAKGRLKLVRESLVERGVLRHHRDKALGLFPYSRYLPGQPTVEADARSRLRTAVDAGRAFDARTAALASLVYALHMEKLAVPDRRPRDVRKALKVIAEGSWAGEAARKAVEETQAAVMAAVVAATAASAAASSSGG
ncbi:GOLPH3/VPS74 family protein [Glycomyces salinus]|uniref:GOLPH3/VPS74 family protein n=1 Tax=Glycomyces salinus TaxID=980294 RepID=UPI0018ED536B|nr:GPP34 family phosphoprotein [Glycomyces salinus]